MLCRIPVSAALLIVLSATALCAQQTALNLDLGFSHARPPSDVVADPSSYVILGARGFAGPLFGALYGGLATDAEGSHWGAGSVGLRADERVSGGVALGLTAAASAFTVEDPQRYRAASARLLPELRLSAGATTALLRGRGGVGRSEVTEAGPAPRRVLSDLWLYGGLFELSQAIGDVRVRGGAESYEAAGGTYRAAYAGGSGPLGQARWEVELRVWDTPIRDDGGDDLEPQLEIGLSVPLGSAFSVEMSGGRSGPDPLLGTPAGVDGSLFVSWRALGGRLPAPAPLYALAEVDGRPGVVFRLRRPGAETVAVIGDFTAWEPLPLHRQGDYWVARIPVEPGTHHFGFLVDGEWYVPDGAPGRVTDEFGQENATLVVPAGDGKAP